MQPLAVSSNTHQWKYYNLSTRSCYYSKMLCLPRLRLTSTVHSMIPLERLTRHATFPIKANFRHLSYSFFFRKNSIQKYPQHYFAWMIGKVKGSVVFANYQILTLVQYLERKKKQQQTISCSSSTPLCVITGIHIVKLLLLNYFV